MRDTSRKKRKSANLKDSLWRYSMLLEARFLPAGRLSSHEAVHQCCSDSRPWAGVREKAVEHGCHTGAHARSCRRAVRQLYGREAYIAGYTAGTGGGSSIAQPAPLCASELLLSHSLLHSPAGTTLRRGHTAHSPACTTLRRGHTVHAQPAPLCAGSTPTCTAGTTLRRGYTSMHSRHHSAQSSLLS